MFGRELFEVRPQSFGMDQTRGRQHEFLHDLVYKWTPLGLVVYLFIVCTALLSVSGKLTYAEVVGFCVTAGLLIAFFATCHLALYCTRIRDQMDLEKNHGNSSATSSNSGPGDNVPADQNCQPSAGAPGQPAPPRHNKNGKQLSQTGPSDPKFGVPHNHPAGPRPNTQARVEDSPDEEPVRPPLRVTNGVQRSSISTNHLQPQPHSQRVRSHVSAAPEPLSTRTQRADHLQGGGGPREYIPYRRPDPKTPSSHPGARNTSDAVGDVSHLHTAGLTPEEAMDSLHRTMGREPWTNSQGRLPSLQRRLDQPSGRHQRASYALGNGTPGHRAGRQLFPGSPSTPNSLVRLPTRLAEVTDLAGPQNHPVELSAGSVQGYLFLLQEPDLMDLRSRRLLEWKARPCPLDRPGHDNLGKPVTPRDDPGVVVLDNSDRKSVNVHDAPVTVGRMRSQKALVQNSPSRPSRRSADSGYCSVNTLPRSFSTPSLHAEGRHSAAPSISSVGSRFSASLERRLSVQSEGQQEDTTGMVLSEDLDRGEIHRRLSTSS
ncbi:hypothetical protein VSDG_06569 [Cytospora chrysosperma]|uniref:Uncharacterized protein n=1 Tax=Cytospora chrysosperma TaxID=252740 RepID=A0A423VNR0_CYTCH|nr:hypothetical protein VSDG_06569 [Valsa sordida]